MAGTVHAAGVAGASGTVAAPRPGGPVHAAGARAAGSAWLPSAPCTPAACAPPEGSPAGVARAVPRLAALLALLFTGIALAPLAGHLPDGPVRRWCRWLVRAAGVRVRITGRPAATDGGVLLVADHVSWLDVPLLAAVRPARMLAKREIGAWPVAGRLAARAVVLIDRDRLRALPGTVARVTGALRAGAAVGVFPEGSTWCGRARGRFRRAVFQAALDAGVPVQPVRIRYRRPDGTPATAPAFVGEDTLLASVWRVTRTRHLVAEVDVRDAIPPGTHHDRRTLAAAAERAVREDTCRRDDRGRWQERGRREDRGRHEGRGRWDDRGGREVRGGREDRGRRADRGRREDRGRPEDRGRREDRHRRDDRPVREQRRRTEAGAEAGTGGHGHARGREPRAAAG